MAKKRDIVQEILETRTRKSRRQFPVAPESMHLIELFLALDRLKKLSRGHQLKVMLRYMPVGYVACLEAYFKRRIRELIERGSPYRENAGALDDRRLDFAALVQMHAQRVTVGEVIAHVLSFSSIDDINRHMSTILGIDFFTAIKEKPLFEKRSFGSENPKAWNDLEGLFHDRHAACHELDRGKGRTFARAFQQWRVAINLITVTEKVIRDSYARH